MIVLVGAYSVLSQAAKVQIKKVRHLEDTAMVLSSRMEQFQNKTFTEVLAENNKSFASGAGTISVKPLSAELLMIRLRLGQRELQTFKSKYD